jgi:hypothetical protein|tara:strand:+ start:156 stop:335 length:180 start_codon:yes stop_codon:yes gene_type:complete
MSKFSRADNGKGSKRRPQSIPAETFGQNWARIFEKNKAEEKRKADLQRKIDAESQKDDD